MSALPLLLARQAINVTNLNVTNINDCTVETCPMTLAIFRYIPTLPGNVIFAVIFGLLFIGQIALGIKYRTWGYMTAMLLGLILEIIGYVGRILIHYAPFNNNDFLIYLVTLTIAPAFLSASIYLCLSRIVIVYGEHLSHFKPRTYTIVFCSCDFISLILQAVGGGIASTGNTISAKDIGKYIMLAGLAFQVFSLILFSCAATLFAFQVWNGNGLKNERYLPLVQSRLFKAFLIGLAVATVTIFARSVYRCVELSGGFTGALFVNDEAVFMVMEGLMIIIACSCLTFLHPAVCFQGSWHEASFKFNGNDEKAGEKLAGSRSGSDPELGAQHAPRATYNRR